MREQAAATPIWEKNDLLHANPYKHTVSLSWGPQSKVLHGIKLHQVHGEASSVNVLTLVDQRKLVWDLLRA